MMSFPGQRARSATMSSQLTLGLNIEPVPSIVVAPAADPDPGAAPGRDPVPVKFAKSIASLRSIRIQ